MRSWRLCGRFPVPVKPSFTFIGLPRPALTGAISSNRLKHKSQLAWGCPAMSYYRSVRVVAILAGLMIPAQALALEFVTVGPRAMGMGGAGVAITTDALATYWNPAGLAMTQTVDIRMQGGGQVIDRNGIADAVHDLENFNTTDTSAPNLAKAQDIANRINRPGATVSLNGSAGLYIKGHFGEHAFGLNVSDVATAGGFVRLLYNPPSLAGLALPLVLQDKLHFLDLRPDRRRSPMPMPSTIKRFLSG